MIGLGIELLLALLAEKDQAKLRRRLIAYAREHGAKLIELGTEMLDLGEI